MMAEVGSVILPSYSQIVLREMSDNMILSLTAVGEETFDSRKVFNRCSLFTPLCKLLDTVPKVDIHH